MSPALDIYLQSVDVGQPIHLWKSVTTSDGQLSTSFVPTWWNSTKAATLQIVITGADQPAWAGYGPGPAFFAEFNGTVPASASAADKATTQLGGPSVEIINAARSKGLSAGSLAAAILVPLLAIVTLMTAYVVISRRRSGAASKRWSQYVDQRMSTAVGGGGWEAGRLPTDPTLPRPVSARVASMYRHSASLPSRESFAAGAHPRFSTASNLHQRSPSSPNMTQYRQSTVSFADAPATHRGHKSSLSVNTGVSKSQTPLELLLSPDQENGPATLGRVAVNRNSVASNLSGGQSPGHNSSPSMARSASNLRFEVEDTTRGNLAPPSLAFHPPASTTATGQSQAMPWDNSFWQSSREPDDSCLAAGNADGMRTLSTVRTSALNPDEALRQYTLARERGTTSTAETLASPSGMRVLYSNSGSASPAPPMSRAMPSVYTEASRYSNVSDGTNADVPTH